MVTAKEDTISLIRTLERQLCRIEWVHTIAAYRVLQRSVIGGSIPDMTAKVPSHTSYKTMKTPCQPGEPIALKNKVYIYKHICPENKQFLWNLMLKCKEA